MFSWIIFFCIVWSKVTAQNCLLSEQTEIEGTISEFLQNSDASNTDPVTISSFQYTCQAQGDRRDTYRQLSVIASYTNAVVGTQTRHFQLVCQGNQWDPSLSEGLETPPNNYQSLSTRTDCRQCTNAFGDDHHCRPCSPACPGSGRCTAFEMCCSYFATDGTCTNDCTVSDGINYISGTASTNFTCTCNLTCDPGYSDDINCTTCIFTDICERDAPCENGGTCTLLSSPDNYTCSCAGTYTGVNCTDTVVTLNTPSPSPSSSPSPSPSPLPSPSSSVPSSSPSPSPLPSPSSSVPSSSPSPSPAQCLLTGCDTCDNERNCCEICTSGYTLNNNCSCVTTPFPLLVSNCSIDNCEDCGTDDCCKTCKINYFLSSCGCVHNAAIAVPVVGVIAIIIIAILIMILVLMVVLTRKRNSSNCKTAPDPATPGFEENKMKTNL